MVIPVLVTLDEKYLPYLKVLLTSMNINDSKQSFDIYVLHSNLSEAELLGLVAFSSGLNSRIIPITASKGIFSDAKITYRYPKEMYYRLLASEILPKELDKILYLDPDILVINSLLPLWEMDMQGKLFAASSHAWKTNVANNFNHIRLGSHTDYYNSGVLVIDLKSCREKIVPKEIFDFVEKKEAVLLFPDQDILNALYGDEILPIKDVIWNYDARNYFTYLIRSLGENNMDWVMNNTSILHFCGKEKPWDKSYRYRFGPLYKHYMAISKRIEDMRQAAEPERNLY